MISYLVNLTFVERQVLVLLSRFPEIFLW